MEDVMNIKLNGSFGIDYEFSVQDQRYKVAFLFKNKNDLFYKEELVENEPTENDLNNYLHNFILLMLNNLESFTKIKPKEVGFK